VIQTRGILQQRRDVPRSRHRKTVLLGVEAIDSEELIAIDTTKTAPPVRLVPAHRNEKPKAKIRPTSTEANGVKRSRDSCLHWTFLCDIKNRRVFPT